MANNDKNRYMNIPACKFLKIIENNNFFCFLDDHSCVVLKHSPSGSDYINANYIEVNIYNHILILLYIILVYFIGF